MANDEFGMEISIEDYTPDFSFRSADAMMRQIAERIVSESKTNIRQQREFYGTPMTPLEPSTIRTKKSLGVPQPKKALIRYGNMLRRIRAKKVNRSVYSIGVSPPSDKVAARHQDEGVGRKKTVRAFIGYSDKIIKFIDARVGRYVNERINKAMKKTTKIKG